MSSLSVECCFVRLPPDIMICRQFSVVKMPICTFIRCSLDCFILLSLVHFAKGIATIPDSSFTTRARTSSPVFA